LQDKARGSKRNSQFKTLTDRLVKSLRRECLWKRRLVKATRTSTLWPQPRLQEGEEGDKEHPDIVRPRWWCPLTRESVERLASMQDADRARLCNEGPEVQVNHMWIARRPERDGEALTAGDRWVPLTSVVQFALQVDDVMLSARGESLYRRWARFLLWFLYDQASLVTNPWKNDLPGRHRVEYNGYVLDIRDEATVSREWRERQGEREETLADAREKQGARKQGEEEKVGGLSKRKQEVDQTTLLETDEVRKGVVEEAKEGQVLCIRTRDTTGRKLVSLVDDWTRSTCGHGSWGELVKILGFLQWFCKTNTWARAQVLQVNL
jgi:hypothetical protein